MPNRLKHRQVVARQMGRHQRQQNRNRMTPVDNLPRVRLSPDNFATTDTFLPDRCLLKGCRRARSPRLCTNATPPAPGLRFANYNIGAFA